MYWGSSPYLNFSVNGTDQDLVNMSYSLWAEIGHANTVYNSLKGANASESVKNQCKGEVRHGRLWPTSSLSAHLVMCQSVHDVIALGRASSTNCIKSKRLR